MPMMTRLFVAILLSAMFLLSTSGYCEDAKTKTIHQQPSYTVQSPQVDLAITETGGHMSPVTFYRDTEKPIQPYYVSPWQDEPASEMPVPVLVPLRGDFFCMPFGGNNESVGNEKHPPHGEIAGAKWKSLGIQKNGKVTTLAMTIDTKLRPGKVTKEINLVDSHNVIYTKHTIEGFAGRVPLGHHATLAMPDQEETVRLSASPFQFGMTYPGTFSDPKQGEYQSLQPGTKWNSLDKVPVAWKGAPDADLTKLPARKGYADLIQLINEPWEKTNGPAWMTATFTNQNFIWFSLKDPAVLRSTVFWIENHGRHGHPWKGRNNCLGLEDVTAYFADGLKASTEENILSKSGIPTAVELKSDRPTTILYIQGVVKVPDDFEQVQTLEFSPGEVTFVSTHGKKVKAAVQHEFLKSGKL